MFVTTNTLKRKPIFRDPAFAREAVDNLYRVQKQHPFHLFGFVIMPDHCHFLLYVPAPESISRIMRMYKLGVVFSIGLGPIWQSRFHLVIPKSSASTLKYIHQNPVETGLVTSPEEYPWSSASGKWKVTSLD